tara:strand:- start:10327 stop:10674 length:348 start_codon:yes stop_codon:yes gene_type:complete
MAVPAEKPRKKTLEERRAEVQSERERMREKTEERRQEVSEELDETGWSDEDKQFVANRRRELLDDDWAEVPDERDDFEVPKEWYYSIWLKIGVGVVVAIAFYVIFQGWGDGLKVG